MLSAEEVLIILVHLTVDELCISEGQGLQMRCIYQRDAVCRISVNCKYPYIISISDSPFTEGEENIY